MTISYRFPWHKFVFTGSADQYLASIMLVNYPTIFCVACYTQSESFRQLASFRPDVFYPLQVQAHVDTSRGQASYYELFDGRILSG